MRLPAHNLSSAVRDTGVTRKAVVSAWFIVLAIFALSGSGMRSAGGLLLFAGGLMALAIVGPMAWSMHGGPQPATKRDEAPFGSTDQQDLVRMDSDKG
jgi:hypothetical protein